MKGGNRSCEINKSSETDFGAASDAVRQDVRYVEDMEKATLAEFNKEEAKWRETAERQVSNLCEIEDPLPTPEELDELDPGEAIRRIETVVENNAQLCVAAEGDTRSWGEMALARVKARTKAKQNCVVR
jgi:hypothetical protein